MRTREDARLQGKVSYEAAALAVIALSADGGKVATRLTPSQVRRR